MGPAMNQVAVGITVQADPARCRATVEAAQERSELPVRLLLLPDDPDEATRLALSSWKDLPQLPSEPPFGGAACFNRLAAATEEPVIVLLESGCLPGPGWLKHLLEALAAGPRHGLTGPSTNRAWNEQRVFPQGRDEREAIRQTAREAVRRFGTEVRGLEPLHSLADFCYVVRREVIADVGPADEGYGLGPCWEMDYSLRAARAGWRAVWACSAYVWRAPPSERRRRQEARLFEASKRRYQDKFCGARQRGTRTRYCRHCRGEACPEFAPPELLKPGGKEALPPAGDVPTAWAATVAPGHVEVTNPPLVSCIMPTCDRLPFVPQAVAGFRRQDYAPLELIVVDDGAQAVEPLLPPDPRIRLVRLPEKQCIGTKRNLACAAARGEFIAHWDDDDWYPRDRLQRQTAALARGRSVLCGTSRLYYYDAAADRAWRYRYQGGRGWVAGNTLAYSKSWWSTHPFPEIQVGEDSPFVWGASPGALCDLRQPELCVARIHDGNTSRKATSSRYWESWPVSELETLLGAEWPAFARTGAPPPEPGLPLVSCIMPTYHRRAFLPLALEAFQAQDYPSKELVVVDDGEDQVADLVSGLASVRHLALRRRTSIGAKRNLACAAARGRLIAHWDDDDWYGPTRLSWQVAPLLAGEAEVTGLENSCQLELATGEFWRTTPELHRRLFVGDVHGGTLVYWKRLFDEGLRYPDVNLAEDAMFLRQVQRRGSRLLRVANPGLFVYMRHSRNSWRFATGEFLDRNGWQRTARPDAFPEPVLRAFRRAAGLGEQRAADLPVCSLGTRNPHASETALPALDQ